MRAVILVGVRNALNVENVAVACVICYVKEKRKVEGE
jgi:hypothetical protein